jgi:hypothetical protein
MKCEVKASVLSPRGQPTLAAFVLISQCIDTLGKKCEIRSRAANKEG